MRALITLCAAALLFAAGCSRNNDTADNPAAPPADQTMPATPPADQPPATSPSDNTIPPPADDAAPPSDQQPTPPQQ